MTTYTLNQEQIDDVVELLVTSLHHMPAEQGSELVKDTNTAIHMLRNLQPNTQEPVAWLIDGLDVVMSYARAKAEQAEHHAMGGTAVAYPIYTHPATQQKPLTDEQIQGIWNVASGSIPGWCRHITYARAIEAAHGIKP